MINDGQRPISILASLSRQFVLMCIAGGVALVTVFVITAVGHALELKYLAGWFGHGFFVVPWVFLFVLLYCALAILDDRRQAKKRAENP